MPGYAPAVSMNERIGRPNFSASSITRSALRKPSGRGMPKLRRIFSFVSRPFWWPTTATGTPRKIAKPAMIAGSSAYLRSPWSSTKSVISAWT